MARHRHASLGYYRSSDRPPVSTAAAVSANNAYTNCMASSTGADASGGGGGAGAKGDREQIQPSPIRVSAACVLSYKRD